MKLIDLINEQSARIKNAGVSFGHGTTNAFDEAVWLVLWCLKMPWTALEQNAQTNITLEDQAQVEALVTLRIESRQPTAYLTQEAWLQNIPFYVDERTIIPRSFIAELLVDEEGQGILDAWLSNQTQRALDLCTGNGSLAVIAAMAFPELEIDATDISPDALAVAQINVEKHAMQGRIRLFLSDLFDKIQGPYDVILCNPPYVNSQSMAHLPPEYRAEPELALAGGSDGLNLVRRIIQDAPQHLSDIGVLVLEIGNERRHFERAFKQLEVAWLETSAGSDQVLVLTREALLKWWAQQASC